MKTWSIATLLSLVAALGAKQHHDPLACGPVLQKCPPKMCHFSNVTFTPYGQWLFLQPNSSNISYAAEAFPYNTGIAVPAVSPSWQIFEINPSYHSGFEVGSQVFFANHDFSLEVNWERLHSQDFASMTVSPQPYGTGNMVGPLSDIGPNSSAYKQAQGKALFHFDSVDVIVGKSLCFVDGLTTRFYTGAGFAKIKQQLDNTYTAHPATTGRSISSSSTFIGGGPQFGFNFDYQLVRSFHFNGSSLLALYMGQLKNQLTYGSFSPNLAANNVPQPNKQRTNVPNRTQVIPGFEEKLGFSYVYSGRQFEITVGAGYQVQIYLDAIQSINMTAPQVLPSISPAPTVDMGVYAVGFDRTLSNFILTGPYVSANVDF